MSIEFNEFNKVRGVVLGFFGRRVILQTFHLVVDVGIYVGSSDSLSGARETIFETRGDFSFSWHRDACKHVCDVCSRRVFETEGFKEGFCRLSRTIVDCHTVVQNKNVIDEVVDTITGLVKRQNRTQAKYIGDGPDSLSPSQSGRCIQA